MRCVNCKSELIYIKNVIKYQPAEFFLLTCKECGKDFDLEEIIEEIIIEELVVESHIAAMEGTENPYTSCPECDKSCYVFAEECCIACGYQLENKNCIVCGNKLDLEESYNGELCSYHKYNMENDD